MLDKCARKLLATKFYMRVEEPSFVDEYVDAMNRDLCRERRKGCLAHECVREKGHEGPHVQCKLDRHKIATWGDPFQVEPKP